MINFFVRPIIFLVFLFTLIFSPAAQAKPYFVMDVDKVSYQNNVMTLTATIRNLGDTYATVTGVDINRIVIKSGNSQSSVGTSNLKYRNMSVYIPAGGAVSNLIFRLNGVYISVGSNNNPTCTTECTFYWQ